MWQFQWMISLIPDSVLLWIYYSFIAVGLLLYFGSKLFKRFPFKYIPFLGQFPILSEISGVALTVLGIFLYGGYATEMSWRAKVAEVEAKVAVAEEKSKTANVVIEHKAQQKIKVIREKGIVVKQYIDREITKYDNTCVIPKEFIKAHNDSAEAPK